jgi:hypothetical protein
MRRATWFAFLLLFLAGTACHNDGDTIIVDADCGLIRSDLLGEWTVSFTADTSTLFNCSNPTFNNDTVTVNSTAMHFTDMEVFASASNAGFQFHNSSSPQIIFGNVETDTCNMLFAFMDNEAQYLQCIGTFDPSSGLFRGACDSTTVLANTVDDPPNVLSDCELSPILSVTLTIQ